MWTAVVLLAAAGTSSAQAGEAQTAVGKCVTADGTVLTRQAPGKSWQVLKQGDSIRPDYLLLGLPRAEVESSRGVRLTFLSDVNRNSPYPIAEAAVLLHQTPGFDLDFTLDRGRVDVANIKKEGSARVRLRFHKEVWEATLGPGARMAVELAGCLPKAASVWKEPESKPKPPPADLMLLVRKGEVRLQHGGNEHLLTAPPGPAIIHWDNYSHTGEPAPERLDTLPSWATAEVALSEEARKRQARLEHVRRLLVEKSPQDTIEELFASSDPEERHLAIIMLGATDNFVTLANLMQTARDMDTWNQAVVVVRHWLARNPGQQAILVQRAMKERKFTRVEAETFIHLLHSFDPTDLAEPETYQMLIRFLAHDKLAIRGLAYWHLYRLVPAGQKIKYNPVDPKEAREHGRQEWKKLVPPGEVPPGAADRS